MIFGLDTAPIPEGAVALEAVAIIKALDEDGSVTMFTRSTDGPPAWDRVGMLTIALDLDREYAQNCFVDIKEEDEDDE